MFLPSMRGIRMHPFSRVSRAEALARSIVGAPPLVAKELGSTCGGSTGGKLFLLIGLATDLFDRCVKLVARA